MAEILIAVLIISSIGAVLAALLIFSESVIANYGECEIDINDGEKTLTVNGGASLLSSLVEKEVFIPSACGGRGTCGYCKVRVLEGGGPISPVENPFLTKQELEDNVRLSCQVKIRGPVSIQVPKELLSVKQYTAVVEKITDLTYDIKQLRFKLSSPDTIDYIPGQYVQLLAPKYKGNSEEAYRAYSISADPNEKDVIELIIRKVPNGICTTYVFEHLKEGDTVRFNGPYGEFALSDTDSDIICIAGGSGLAPIKCLLHHMKNIDCKRNAYFFFGGRSLKDMFHDELMQMFEKELPSFKYIPVVGEPEDASYKGETGLVTDAVRRQFEDLSNAEGYLCGSPGMINASNEVLTSLGVPKEKVYYDSFA